MCFFPTQRHSVDKDPSSIAPSPSSQGTNRVVTAQGRGGVEGQAGAPLGH